jgi:hypothetical protein
MGRISGRHRGILMAASGENHMAAVSGPSNETGGGRDHDGDAEADRISSDRRNQQSAPTPGKPLTSYIHARIIA